MKREKEMVIGYVNYRKSGKDGGSDSLMGLCYLPFFCVRHVVRYLNDDRTVSFLKSRNIWAKILKIFEILEDHLSKILVIFKW